MEDNVEDNLDLCDQIKSIESISVFPPNDDHSWISAIMGKLHDGRHYTVTVFTEEKYIDIWALTHGFQKLTIEDKGNMYEYGRFAIHIMNEDKFKTVYAESAKLVAIGE